MVNLEGAGIKRPSPPTAQDAFERVRLVGLKVSCGGIGVVWQAIIVTALSLSLRDKKDRENEKY